MNIVRGRARERSGPSWEAELLVEVPGGSSLPTPAELVDLTRREAAGGPPAAASSSLRLAGHRLERTASEIVLEVRGRDEVGFLDRVLRLLALYGLFPAEMQLETAGGEVRDLFRLRSLAGTAPGSAACDVLGAGLRRLAGGAGELPPSEP